MVIHEFLKSIAEQLGDNRPGNPFRRYTLASLIAYYNEAMCFVAARRPDLFTGFKVIKLATGQFQDATCCGCVNVLSVVSQLNAAGDTVKDFSSQDTSARSSANRTKWYRPVCRTDQPGATVVIQTVKILGGQNGAFQVYPPVPEGADVYLKVRCVQQPCGVDEAAVLAGDSVPGWCQFLPAIRSYVLYRALQGDRQAVGATNEAQAERRAMYDFLQLAYDAEQKQEGEA